MPRRAILGERNHRVEMEDAETNVLTWKEPLSSHSRSWERWRSVEPASAEKIFEPQRPVLQNTLQYVD
jgi:hypothetical protein